MSQNQPLSRRTRQARIGQVPVGGGAPIVVQSMTNTDTADVAGTVAQVADLHRAGSELVRITVNTPEAAAQVANTRGRLDALGCDVPLIGDFHYNGHRLLTEFPDCARALAKDKRAAFMARLVEGYRPLGYEAGRELPHRGGDPALPGREFRCEEW